jgi:hypothetical protein
MFYYFVIVIDLLTTFVIVYFRGNVFESADASAAALVLFCVGLKKLIRVAGRLTGKLGLALFMTGEADGEGSLEDSVTGLARVCGSS